MGWFSIALGLAEVVAPEKIAGELGLEDKRSLVRLYGFREIAKGMGILSNRKPAGWVWGRVAGDVLDLATLASEVRRLRKGDRVVVPFTISCGACFFCQKTLYSLCETTNRNADLARKVMGHTTAGLFGYSHLTGGYAGGQAQYLRVPYADVGPLRIDSDLPDEQVLFLSDIFPTGWMAAVNADIEPGDTVAVWGCGPVGQFTIQSAWLLGAGRVIAIDTVPERLEMARTHGRAETIDFMQVGVYGQLMEMTKGRGPDRCIDAVGAEAHATATLDSMYDKAKTMLMQETDRPHVFREAIMCCRPGGTISMPGVYLGVVDKVPLGAFMNKALTLKDRADARPALP